MIKNSDVLLEVDDTLMEGLISEIYEISEEEFKETKTWLKDMEKDSRLLAADVLIDIPPPSKAILKNKIVIGVDAGSAQRKYDAISLLLAASCTYSSKLPNTEISQKYGSKIVYCPPYKSDIAISLYMRGLEYLVAHASSEEFLSNGEKPDLILFDGPLTFPEEMEMISEVSWIKKAYSWFLQKSNSFFEFVKREKIPVVSVTKDPMANKYLKSIYLQFIRDVEPRCKSELRDISNSYNLFEERWDRYEKMSELGIIKRAMWDKKLMRTKAIEITTALKEEMPIKFLREGVCGFYIKIEKDRRPYFVEIPCFFMDKINEIISVLTSFSYYSPFRGYPSPLYFAHKTATLTQKFSENVFSLAHMSARRILGGDYPVLFEERYREEM